VGWGGLGLPDELSNRRIPVRLSFTAAAPEVHEVPHTPIDGIQNALRNPAELPLASDEVKMCTELSVKFFGTRLASLTAEPPLKNRTRGPNSGARA
jgi:hypothetical protein